MLNNNQGYFLLLGENAGLHPTLFALRLSPDTEPEVRCPCPQVALAPHVMPNNTQVTTFTSSSPVMNIPKINGSEGIVFKYV